MATDAEYDAVLADKELFERRWNDSVAENAKLRADLEKLSKGLYDRCVQGSPFIQTSSVDTALAMIDRGNLQIEEARYALGAIYANEGPGLDGSSENASGRIARICLENLRKIANGEWKVTEKRNISQQNIAVGRPSERPETEGGFCPKCLAQLGPDMFCGTCTLKDSQ